MKSIITLVVTVVCLVGYVLGTTAITVVTQGAATRAAIVKALEK